MSFIKPRLLQNVFLFNSQNIQRILLESSKILQVRCYAARKGTRERKRKAKVKVEIKKVGFIPHNQRDKTKFLQEREPRKFNDVWKRDPIDDVFPMKYYKWIVYPFEEAVNCHRETHHPDMYNKPNANLHVTVELNMQGEKANRFVDNFSRIVGIPYKFDHGEERNVIAFSKNSEDQNDATAAGAQLSGGVELIKQIQAGTVSLADFQYILAHPNILPELVVLRGLMKRRFPSPKLGTLDVDLKEATRRFIDGISYRAVKDEYEKDFGSVETILGTLDMDAKHLEGNFAALIVDINKMKPKRQGPFITRCILWSPPSQEKLKVDHSQYVVEESEEKPKEDEELEDKTELVAL